MHLLDRSAVIVRRKQPFADWAHSLHPEGEKPPLSWFNQDPTVHLLPRFEMSGDSERFVEHYRDNIAEWEFIDITLDRSAWPALPDLNAFLRYFRVEPFSTVLDAWRIDIDVQVIGAKNHQAT